MCTIIYFSSEPFVLPVHGFKQWTGDFLIIYSQILYFRFFKLFIYILYGDP